MQYAQRIDEQSSSNLEALLAAPKAGQVSFAGGLPDPDLFPEAELATGFAEAISQSGDTCLQYNSAAGYLPLREKVAQHLQRSGVPATADSLMLTQGAQQALDLIGRLFIDPGTNVVVEGPTYAGALAAFNAYQPHYLTVPVRPDGMDMGILKTQVQQHDVRLVYTVPDFQNPTGTVMSLTKRQQLLALAEQYDFMIVEDAPYRDLRYKGVTMPSLYELDHKDRVIHVGSFSKILSPGLRLGWLSANPELLTRLIDLKNGADLESSNLMMRGIDNYLQANDLSAHIEQLRQSYARKCQTMVTTLQTNLPGNVQCSNPDGGFFVWLQLPRNMNTETILATCSDDVTFVPSTTLYASGADKSGMRLAFTNPSVTEIKRGAAILANTISRAMTGAVAQAN
ncbi:PLP-dependent aminotransferase family protein [Lacticaseibacillus pabuli]|uniref:PLP-dependent aminotransferase family protein n=1 Tax=Lacticaseibacillus pabuli TaxID=3025672 RepID=A0ABY7WRN9_9LACO|nr:PLP-dependent aminotransferase family protein [Lacticaseibacillus sp. KACC 23028]WDF82459.1 PLP-dependent aminotransferase family protein [Lacticaseibacillus sp. KACC 23028]